MIWLGHFGDPSWTHSDTCQQWGLAGGWPVGTALARMAQPTLCAPLQQAGTLVGEARAQERKWEHRSMLFNLGSMDSVPSARTSPAAMASIGVGECWLGWTQRGRDMGWCDPIVG